MEMVAADDRNYAINYPMEQDIAQSKTITLTQLQTLLCDSRVAELLHTQISLLPKSTFSLRRAYNHLFVIINVNQYKLEKERNSNSQAKQSLKVSDVDSIYTLKISKRFPLKESMHLLMLDGGFQPKISDCRDLMEEVMGRPYHYSMSFVDIFDALVNFDDGLHHKNELFLEMQKIGKFNLGERYFYHQISELYSSLILLKDLNGKKSNIYIGVGQTHILTFKELEKSNQKESLFKLKHPKTIAISSQKELAEKQLQQQTLNQLILVSSAELQCIESIQYKESEKVVRLVYRKYKSIKLYHQFQEIKRQYKFRHPQVLLRAVLKHIAKFQQCYIQFDPFLEVTKKDKKPTISESMVTHRENERINFYIDQTSRIQQLLLKKQSNEEQRKKGLQNLNRFYQKLIEHFSIRASPYYLIYVNKLNLIYSKYYQRSENKP